MMLNYKCCIVIPIHNVELNPYEEMSIYNIIDLYINKYDIKLIHKNNFDISNYKKFNLPLFEINEWEDNMSFDILSLKHYFYEYFLEYEYILISDTNSLILNDKLDYWISKNYDYIGALDILNNNYILNGNFSLRKTNVFINVCKFIENKIIFNKDINTKILLSILSSKILYKSSFEDSKYFCLSNLIQNEEVYNNFIEGDIFATINYHEVNGLCNSYLNKNYYSYVKLKSINKFCYLYNKYTKETFEKKCAVIIPIYNTTPDLFEDISIINTIRLCKNKYDIIFLHSELLDITYYKTRYNDIDFLSVSSILWDNTYTGYNNMCIRYNFYDLFNKYQYIFICQTDAIIFNNDIDKWINMNYDYYGGPSKVYSNMIFWKDLNNENLLEYISNNDCYNLNGGLSLRKVKAFKLASLIINMFYIYDDSEDIMFSTLSGITQSNVIKNCPYDILEYFSNDYNKISNDKIIEDLFGCHAIHRIHKNKVLIADDQYETYHKISDKFVKYIYSN